MRAPFYVLGAFCLLSGTASPLAGAFNADGEIDLSKIDIPADLAPLVEGEPVVIKKKAATIRKKVAAPKE